DFLAVDGDGAGDGQARHASSYGVGSEVQRIGLGVTADLLTPIQFFRHAGLVPASIVPHMLQA
ncbi:MAG: hypothetical protein ABI810_14695, partial [Sphingomonas bacterium]